MGLVVVVLLGLERLHVVVVLGLVLVLGLILVLVRFRVMVMVDFLKICLVG